jgi:flagellar assembly protein FliH
MLAKVFKVEGEQVECAPFVLPTADTLPEAEPEVATPARRDHDAELASSLDAQVRAAAARAEMQAAEILNGARAQAARMIADAEAQVARVEREAMERGLDEARAAMGAEVSAAVADLREQLARSLNEVAALRITMAEQSERELVHLALEIAKKVVHREVAIDPDIPLTLARLALARLQRVAAVVRLHPEDFEYVSARREELRATAMIELVSDPAIGRGGCVVESERGDIDARIEQQFANIERGLLHA